jgi:uncharacterized protein
MSRILISGSTGLVGSALLEELRSRSQEAGRLIRPSTRSKLTGVSAPGTAIDVPWDPQADVLDSAAEGATAVVHLAGASIAGKRWTKSRKLVLRESRVAATRQLVSALGRLRRPPQIFVAASAIGIYGDRGDEVLTEKSAPGHGFLADLSREWEFESSRATQFGARVVILRFGIILARHDGALPQMALPFRLGLGGRVGSGRQWVSWISLQDVVRIIDYAIDSDRLSGQINAVAPNPVRNSEFAQDLGAALHRPDVFPAPAFALRLALGELADALLLSSQRVLPHKLEQTGFQFLHAELPSTLRTIYGSR